MELVQIACCECGVLITSNQANMCFTCMKNHIDITSTISKTNILYECSHWLRFLRPPWVSVEPESAQLLSLCLHNTKGLNKKVKIVDSQFIWTEPHSRRLKIRLTIQKEHFREMMIEQSLVVDYKIEKKQCTDCQIKFTPNLWNAQVQLRQRVAHKRTLANLEQIFLKHNGHAQAAHIKQVENGLDFSFHSNKAAQQFVQFIASHAAITIKQSKELISQDHKSNECRYKHTYAVEIPHICKDDLVLLPPQHTSALGGFGPLCLCYKVTNTLYFIDPVTWQTAEISGDRYWKHPFESVCSQNMLVQCVLMDSEDSPGNWPHPKFLRADVEIARESEIGENSVNTFTHLGRVVQGGDTVLWYDTENMGNCEIFPENTPDLIIVKKFEEKKSKSKKKSN